MGRLMWLGLALATVGCGGGNTYSVSGTASFNGEPIERGQVAFISADPAIAPEGGPIERGKFSFPATAGKKRVEIRGSKPLPPEKQDSPGGILYEDFVPARFNDQSELSAEVGPGKTAFAFALQDS